MWWRRSWFSLKGKVGIHDQARAAPLRHPASQHQPAHPCTTAPGRVGHVGRTAKDNRLFVEAVFYRYRTGIPWRDLPERLGCGIKVQTRFSRWAKTGVWERVFQHLAIDADNEYAMIDSTIVRAHQHAAGTLYPIWEVRLIHKH